VYIKISTENEEHGSLTYQLTMIQLACKADVAYRNWNVNLVYHQFLSPRWEKPIKCELWRWICGEIRLGKFTCKTQSIKYPTRYYWTFLQYME